MHKNNLTQNQLSAHPHTCTQTYTAIPSEKHHTDHEQKSAHDNARTRSRERQLCVLACVFVLFVFMLFVFMLFVFMLFVFHRQIFHHLTLNPKQRQLSACWLWCSCSSFSWATNSTRCKLQIAKPRPTRQNAESRSLFLFFLHLLFRFLVCVEALLPEPPT